MSVLFSGYKVCNNNGVNVPAVTFDIPPLIATKVTFAISGTGWGAAEGMISYVVHCTNPQPAQITGTRRSNSPGLHETFPTLVGEINLAAGPNALHIEPGPNTTIDFNDYFSLMLFEYAGV